MSATDGSSPWGDPPTEAQFASAHAFAECARRRARGLVLDGALTVEQAAARLGVSIQAVTELVRAGQLVAIDDDALRLPAWQFTTRATLPGLVEVVAAWPGNALTLSLFAIRPHPDLGGRSPAQELTPSGGPRRVLELLQAISPAGW